MKNDIKQKVCTTRYCIGLPSNYEMIFQGILECCEKILNSLIPNKNIKVVCCYSYNIKPSTYKDNNTNTEYVVLDMHLFDYCIDFFYACKGIDSFCKQYMYKYLSEIYYRKGYTADSTLFSELYNKSKMKRVHELTRNDLEVGTISILFVLLHEILHIRPELAEKHSFENLFNNEMKNTLSKLHLEIKGGSNKLVQEGFCDFSSIYMIYKMIEKSSAFDMSLDEVYEICFLTLLSMIFYDLLENLNNIKNVDEVLKGEFYDRFLISNMFASGFDFYNIKNSFIKTMTMYKDLQVYVGDVLRDIPDAASYFAKDVNKNFYINKKIKKEKNLKKDIWIKIF